MKILLVDNSWMVRERLRSLIAAVPHAHLVAEASSDTAARRHWAEHRPGLVVIDPCLRVGSGLDLISHIRALQPSCIIIALTNQVLPEYKLRCKELGADFFFDKTKESTTFISLLTGLCYERSGALATCKTCSHGH